MASQKQSPILIWDDVHDAAAALEPAVAELLLSLSEPVAGTGEGASADSGSPWLIRKIKVRGHVGIGSTPVEIDIPPIRGLVVISARNGTGKTSITDAVRYVMSGGANRDYAIAEDNLHSSEREIIVTITDGPRDVDLVCTGSSQVSWSPLGGQSGSIGQEWARDYHRYKPVLLYPEISPLIDRPDELHDFLKGGLPLDVLEELQTRVDGVKKVGRNAKAAVEAAYAAVLAEPALGDLRDRIVAAGTVPTETAVLDVKAALNSLPGVAGNLVPEIPSWRVDESVAEQCCLLIGQLAKARKKVPDSALALCNALDGLLAVPSDDPDCPVCGSTVPGWQDSALARLESLKADLGNHGQLTKDLREELQRLGNTVPAGPSAQTRMKLQNDADGQSFCQWWDRLSDLRTVILSGAASEEMVRSFSTEARGLGVMADALRRRLDDEKAGSIVAYAGVARVVGNWLEQVERQRDDIERGAVAEKLSKFVDKWIKATRDELFRPIAETVIRIWSHLSSDSDVAVTNLALAGGTRRAGKVSIDLAIGETIVPAGVQSTRVLSTGQRNALALATYFPRVMQPGSGFGFMVLDDPVQSFDRGRVQYLAELLTDFSSTRQIVVFTHDDRLWHELRACGTWAEHIRLDRPAGQASVVRVSNLSSPGIRHLEELDEVTNSSRKFATEEALTALVLAMCRQALDAEVWAQVEILGRKSGMSVAAMDDVREEAGDSRQQLRILNQYAESLQLPVIDLEPFEATITALNSGAHGRVEKANKSRRSYWIRETRKLIQKVRSLNRGSDVA